VGRVKVAHIIADSDIGGAEMMLLKVLRNFKDEEYEHFVVSLKGIGAAGRMIRKEGFRVYALGATRINLAAPFIKLLYVLKKEKPRIVHNYLFPAEIVGRIASKIMRVPIVISSLRSVEIGGRWRERLLTATDFCVDRVTAVSRKVAEAHISKGTTRKSKISVIYNGVERREAGQKGRMKVRQAFGAGDDTFLLMTAGRLAEVKGHTFLFRALESLKNKGFDVKLLVVGGGKGGYRNNLEEEIAQRGLKEEVFLTGETQDMAGMFDASDAFVLPSLWEGMPNVLIEAMESGLPVVATRVGGVPEAVTDNASGLLVEPRDSGALSEAIERVIKDTQLRSRLARNAKNVIREKFDISGTVTGTKRLYEDLSTRYGTN